MFSIQTRNPYNRILALTGLLVLLLHSQVVIAQGKASVKWGRFNLLAVDTVWKYKSGVAKPEYFNQHFDDQGWQSVNYKFLDALSPATSTWPGIGVFRKYFKVPDSLQGKQAELFLTQFGASEIYLDGKLLSRLGKVTGQTKDEVIIEYAIPLELDNQSSHVLAIYHSNHIKPSVISKLGITGYSIALSPVTPAYNKDNETFHHAIISLGIILSFCLFFCFVYAFYPNRLASLMSAIYLAIFSLIFAGGLLREFVNTDVKQVLFGEAIWEIGFSCVYGSNLLFLYSIYYNQLPKRSWIIAGMLGISVLLIVSLSPVWWNVTLAFILLYLVETWRILILGIRKKRTGFRILATGFLLSIAGSLVAIFDVFNIFPWYLTTTQTIFGVVTDLTFPLTLALQFAWEFGSANRDLRMQLAQVNDLTKKNLEQEQEKQQILSTQNEMLENQVTERTAALNKSLEHLKATQAQLVQSEKMASLGELTAGIAHEIQNPLNFVNNFSEVSTELIGELQQELDTGDTTEAKVISEDIRQNLEKIHHHGRRADSIVKNMLQHSRASSGERQLTDINALADEYLRLAYHGLKAKDKDFNAKLITDFDEKVPKTEIVSQEIGRVLLNLFNNAFYAVNLKKAGLNGQYQPQITVTTKTIGDKVEISVKDNGTGIPESVKQKIFQPFFTTKPTGEGTGLGLSLSYDIITKGHGGELRVESKEGEYTEFIINLPVS